MKKLKDKLIELITKLRQKSKKSLAGFIGATTALVVTVAAVVAVGITLISKGTAAVIPEIQAAWAAGLYYPAIVTILSLVLGPITMLLAVMLAVRQLPNIKKAALIYATVFICSLLFTFLLTVSAQIYTMRVAG